MAEQGGETGGFQGPFAEPLIKSPELASSRLRIFESDPSTVVRIIETRPGEQAGELKKAVAVFAELRQFGIDVPPVHGVVGSNPRGEAQAYLVTKKVEGIDLPQKLAEGDPNFAKDYALPLCDKLVEYYAAKYKEGGQYLADVLGRQFRFGTFAGDAGPKLYLVDLDFYAPLIDRSQSNRQDRNVFYVQLAETANMIIAAERAAGEPAPALRQKLLDLLNQAEADDPEAGPKFAAIKQAIESVRPLDAKSWRNEAFIKRGRILP